MARLLPVTFPIPPQRRSQSTGAAGAAPTAATTAAGRLRPLREAAGECASATTLGELGEQAGIAIAKFFTVGSDQRGVWTDSVLRGFVGSLSDNELGALMCTLARRLGEGSATSLALAALGCVSSKGQLVVVIDEALHRRQSIMERVELLVGAAQSVRQYGRAEVTLSKKRAGALSRLLLDLVAMLWRRINSLTAQKAPAIVAPDLAGCGFSASNYNDAIACASHTSADIAVSLCEMLLARNDGLLLLLDICQRYDEGAVFKIHFQRHVREPFELAMRNFCGVLFIVQRVPRNTWATLLALQGECEGAFALLGGSKLLLTYNECREESRELLHGYPTIVQTRQLAERGQSVYITRSGLQTVL